MANIYYFNYLWQGNAIGVGVTCPKRYMVWVRQKVLDRYAKVNQSQITSNANANRTRNQITQCSGVNRVAVPEAC